MEDATLPSERGTAARRGTDRADGQRILAFLDGRISSRGNLDHRANSIVGTLRFKTNLILPSVNEAPLLESSSKSSASFSSQAKANLRSVYHRIGGSAQLFQL